MIANRKMIFGTILCLLIATIPALAQLGDGTLDFTTTFPFYAQNAKLPAGSYTIKRSDIDTGVFEIQSTDGVHSVFVECIPTESAEPHKQSDVTFHRYADVDYLNRIWIEGQEYGMKVEPTKAEHKAASATPFTEHSLIAAKP